MKSSQSKVRIGIIGTGGISALHIRGYAKHPQAEIVAVCDAIEERAQKVATEQKIAEVYTDYKVMLKKAKLDAVSICLPNFLHAPAAVAALNAGVHVILEKPLAHTVADGKKIVEAQKKSGKFLMVAFHNRFRSEVQIIKKQIEDGVLGDIYYAKCAWLRRVGIPAWGKWFCTKEQSGGGPMIDIGVHVLDMTLYLMGFPEPVSVSASTYSKLGPKGLGFWGKPIPIDVEDLGVGLVKFKNGATLFLETSWALHTEKEESYVKLFGTEAGAVVDPPVIYGNKNNQLWDMHLQYVKNVPHDEEMIHFVDSILQNKAPLSTAYQGLMSLKILDGMYRSSESGKEIILK